MPIVALVDDDPGVLTGLARMLREEGWDVRTFQSAEAFLQRTHPTDVDCLVLDVDMPGMDGLELQRRLGDASDAVPIVFLTGHGDIPMTVRAVKAGALDFLTKPVNAESLVAAVSGAIRLAARRRQDDAQTADVRRRVAGLTPREREVLAGLVAGKLNKQIAADLGVVEQTIKFHRGRIMERMQARTLAELMHLAARAGVGPAPRATPSAVGPGED